MAKLLDGKVAAITGGVTGIGRAIVIEYLKHGASVAVNHFPDDKSASQYQDLLKETGHDAPIIAVPGDISKPETGQNLVAKAVDRFSRLDVFISNAGV
jgi:L-rhamnose 1-dehydrogenase